MADGFHTPTNSQSALMARRCFSVADVEAMFDADILSREEKIELIDGEIITKNSQMMPHAVLKSRLSRRFAQLLPESFDIIIEGTTLLNAQTLIEPDILIAMRLPGDERRYVDSTELLLAIKIADTSLAYNLGTKALLYAGANIPELWVVDLNHAKTWVHREPTLTGYMSIIQVPFDEVLKAQSMININVIIDSLRN